MKVSRLLAGLAAALCLYSFFLIQESFGRTYLMADQFQLFALLSLILVYSALSALENSLKLALIPLILILSLDIAFSSLMYHGFGQYYSAYESIRLYLALLTLSLAFSSIKFFEREVYQCTVSAASLVVAAISSYYLFSQLSEIFAIPSLALPSFLLFLILAATSLTTAFEGEIFRFISAERSFLIFLLSVLTFYSFLKPYLSDRPGISDFIEWMILASAFVKISRDFKRRVEVEESEIISSHIPKEKIFRDELYSLLEFGEKAFLESGAKIPLAVAIVKSLSDLELKKLSSILSPLLSYEDERIAVLSFPWEKQLIERRNRERRRKIINVLRAEIEKVKDFNR